MQKGHSKRGLAVIKSIEEMYDILDERDKHELLRELVKRIDPVTIVESETKGDVPKWYLKLVLSLTKLYDQGYVDSTKDSEQLK